MSNNQKLILDILTKIYESQKNIKVQTSKYLKRLDLMKLKLTVDEIKLVLLGTNKLPCGLLYCCGNKSKVDSSLRKSSFFSMQLLLEVFEKHPQNQEFMNVFSDLEDEEYKLMSLTTHVLSDRTLKDKGLVAFKVIQVIKDKRPHFDLSVVLESKKVLEQFQGWYKEVRVVQAQQKIQQATWQDQADLPVVENLNLQREITKKQKLEHVSLQFDGSVEYLIKTFYNPFDIKQRITPSTKKREAANKKRYVQDNLTATVDNVQTMELRSKVKNIEQIITKIHLDSSEFDALTFIQVVRPQISKQSLYELEQNNREMNKNIVYMFMDGYFNINQGIMKLHSDFIHKEYKDAQKRNKALQDKQLTQVDEILTLGDLQRRTFTQLNILNLMSQQLNDMRSSQNTFRIVLEFIRKSEGIVGLPVQLRQCLANKDFIQIIKLYQQHQDTIEKYKGISLFNQLNGEIKELLQDIYKEMLLCICNSKIDFTQLTNFVMQLNPQNGGRDIIQNMSNSILDGFLSYFTKILISDSYKVGSIQGDNILEFLKHTVQPGKEQMLQNCKAIEIYVAGQFRDEFLNYQGLIKQLDKQVPQEIVTECMNNLITKINEAVIQLLNQLSNNWFNSNSTTMNTSVYVRIDQDLQSLKRTITILSQLIGPMPQVQQQFDEIDVKAMTEQFRNVTVKQIKLQFICPERDFFGIRFSDFMIEVFGQITKIYKDKNIGGVLFIQLLRDALTYIQGNLVEQFDHLLFLHNLKLISQQIKEIAQDLYNVSMKQMSLKQFVEPLSEQINTMLGEFYQPTLKGYLKLFQLDMPTQMDITPRPYIVEWLSTLNEQLVHIAQLNPDSVVTDSLIQCVIQIYLKLLEATLQRKDRVDQIIQLVHEISLMQMMTTLLQGKVSSDGFQRLLMKAREYAQIELPDTSEWVREQKFKMSFNYKCLYGYYQ